MTTAAPGPLLLFVLGGIALLGNGLKAVISSSVLVSEAQFAAFLRIPVEHVAVLLEAIIAGMVIALAVCPMLLQRYRARALAMTACAIASAAFAVFAAVDLAHPAQWLREVAVFGCFALGSAALACLAPSAQALILDWPAPSGRTTLTTLWSGAAPAGFLLAPQLAKYLLPLFGLAGYFLAFAALPLLMLALLVVLALALPALTTTAAAAPTLPTRPLLAFVAAVVAFEIWSTLGSTTSYTAPSTLVALPVMIAAGLLFVRRLREMTLPAAGAANISGPLWLLAALFVLEMPTTGFFEAAFLFENIGSEALVADRSTLAASAQIAGTIAAGILVRRWPGALHALLQGFAGILFLGIASYVAYPWIDAQSYFLWTPMVAGFGSSGVTVLVLLAVLPAGLRLPIFAVLPSLAIMLGTEFGLELLQLVFTAVKALGADTADAYRILFLVQAGFALAVPVMLYIAQRQPVAVDDT